MRLPAFVREAEKKVQWLLSHPAEELTRAQRTLRYLLDFGRYCAQELRTDRAGEMAAALTYHTLFSLLPMLALMLAIMPVFVNETEREQLKQDIVDFTLQWVVPEDEQPAEASAAEPGDQPAAAAADDAEARRLEFEQLRASIDDNVKGIMNELESIDFRGIGIAGVLLFIYASTKLLTTVEHSFNRIFDAPYSRPMHVRLPLYYAVITLAPLLLVGGQFVQVQIVNALEDAAAVAGQTVGLTGPPVDDAITGAESVGIIGGTIALLTPLVMTWVVLTLLYRFLPNTKVRFKAAIAGGGIAAVALIGAIEGFKVYVRMAGTANLYGALAMVPLFMLWLWVTWLIVLFGVEVTYTSQSMRGRRFKSLQRNQERNSLLDARWIVPIATHIARAFQRGESVSVDELHQVTGLPNRAIAQLIQQLREAGITHVIEDSDPGQPRHTLARPPAQVKLDELLDIAARATTTDRRWQRVTGDSLLEQISDAQRQAAAGHTLDDVARS